MGSLVRVCCAAAGFLTAATATGGAQPAVDLGRLTRTPPRITVTAGNSSREFVIARALDAVRRILGAGMPPVSVTLTAPVPSPLPTPVNGILQLQTTIAVRGGTERRAPIAVTVTNGPSRSPSATRLLVSDDPESLPDQPVNGTIFSASLGSGANRLFLFQALPSANGAAPPPRRIRLRLTNTGARARTLYVLGGVHGPTPDASYAGSVASACYFLRLARAEGEYLTLSPSQSLDLFDVVLHAPGDTINAVYDLQDLAANGTIQMALIASDPDAEPLVFPSATSFAPDRPWRSGVFDVSGVTVAPVDFHVPPTPNDPQYTSILRIGDDCHPVPSVNDGRPRARPKTVTGYPCPPVLNADGYYDLHGDYGVVRRFEIQMQNDTQQPQTAYLYLQPRGGNVQGTFVIDDQLVQARPVSRALPAGGTVPLYKLKALTLMSQERRTVRLATMGDGEAAYPADLLIGGDVTSFPVEALRRNPDVFSGTITSVPMRPCYPSVPR
jgi:hypothetical protein